MAEIKRLDSMALGLIAGLVLPLITLVLVWVVRYEGGLGEFSPVNQLEGMRFVVDDGDHSRGSDERLRQGFAFVMAAFEEAGTASTASSAFRESGGGKAVGKR